MSSVSRLSRSVRAGVVESWGWEGGLVELIVIWM